MVDREQVETVLNCVEEHNKDKGFENFREASQQIWGCIQEHYPDMHPDEQDDLAMEAEQWMNDDFMEPQAVLETWRGDTIEVTRYTSPLGFRAEWHSTDAWRGSYSIETSNRWRKLHSDTILSGHHTEEDLHDMHEAVTAEFDREGVKWVAAFPRTSNVFATGYDLYVDRGDEELAKQIVREVADRMNGGWS